MSQEQDVRTGADPKDQRRGRIITVAKIGITLLGLGLVVARLDVTAITAVLRETDLVWVAAGLFLIGASLVLRAWRWKVILRGAGSEIRFGRLVELYFVGNFFNAFFPSGFGGDIVRAAEAAQDVPASVATGTVILDRLTGLMALFAMALAVLPFRPAGFPQSLSLLILAVCSVGLVAGMVFMDGRLARQVIGRLPPRLQGLGGGFLEQLAAAIDTCSWRALAGAFALSLVFNLMQVGWWQAAGLALGIFLPFSFYLLIVPIMSLLLLLPSIGGLGVREVAAPYLFAGVGVVPEAAVAVSLLVFLMERLASLLGAPVYILANLRSARAAAGRPPLPGEVPDPPANSLSD